MFLFGGLLLGRTFEPVGGAGFQQASVAVSLVNHSTCTSSIVNGSSANVNPATDLAIIRYRSLLLS